MEIIAFAIRMLFEYVVLDLLHLTGKVLVLGLSFGRLHPVALSKSARGSFPSLGPLITQSEGRRVVSPEGQILLGVLFYLLLAVVLVVRHAT